MIISYFPQIWLPEGILCTKKRNHQTDWARWQRRSFPAQISLSHQRMRVRDAEENPSGDAYQFWTRKQRSGDNSKEQQEKRLSVIYLLLMKCLWYSINGTLNLCPLKVSNIFILQMQCRCFTFTWPWKMEWAVGADVLHARANWYHCAHELANPVFARSPVPIS